jgi:tetratricopeptide (TPR) repeat protein
VADHKDSQTMRQTMHPSGLTTGPKRTMRWPAPVAGLLAALVTACNHAQPLPDDLNRAQQAERAQNTEAALAEYDAIVARCRRSPRPESKDPCGTAALRRGQVLEQGGRPAEAVAAYSEARRLSREPRNQARGLARAASLLAGPLGQPADALALCREIMTTWPGEVAAEDALKLYVELGVDGGNPQLGTELLRLAEVLRPHEGVASFALYHGARFLERKGDPAALPAYDEIWRRYPRGPLFDDALMAAARFLRQQGRSSEAAERLERLEASFTKSIIVGHYNKLLLDEGAILLGEIYLQDLGQPEKAIATLNRFLGRQRTSLLCDDALLLMAEAALRRHAVPTSDDRQQACAYLERLIQQYPDGNRVRRAAQRQEQLACPPPPR